MADQKIHIGIGSSFNGEGFAKAETGVKNLTAQSKVAAKGISAVTSTVGQLGGSLQGLGGKMGGVANAFEVLTSTLTGATGGLVGFLAAAGAVGVKIGQWLYEPIKKANEEWKKYHSTLSDVISGTSKLVKQRLERYNREEEKSIAEKNKKIQEEIRTKKALHAANVELVKSENELAKGQRELELLQNKGEWDRAINESDDPRQKRILEAQRDVAQTEIGGNNELKNAEDALKLAEHSYQALKSDTLSEEEYQKRLSIEQNKLEQAQLNYQLVLERITQANENAAAKLNQVQEDVEKERNAERTYNHNSIDNIRSTGRANDRIRDEQKKGNELLKDIDEKIAQVRNNIENSRAINQRMQSGMQADNAYHSGISGNGYQYSTDENGRIRRFDQFRRAGRYAVRGERDAASGGDGPNTTDANWRKAIRLQGRLNDGKKISDRDQKWLDDWNDFNNQNETPGDVVNKLQEIRQQVLDRMKTTLDIIKNDLKDALKTN